MGHRAAPSPRADYLFPSSATAWHDMLSTTRQLALYQASVNLPSWKAASSLLLILVAMLRRPQLADSLVLSQVGKSLAANACNMGGR